MCNPSLKVPEQLYCRARCLSLDLNFSLLPAVKALGRLYERSGSRFSRFMFLLYKGFVLEFSYLL